MNKNIQNIDSEDSLSNEALMEKCQKQMPDNIRQYLLERGITEGQIRAKKLGYGFFYGKWWITLPIFDQVGNFGFFKLRQEPFDMSHSSKGKVWPKGAKVEIYGWEEWLEVSLYCVTKSCIFRTKSGWH